MSTHARVKDVVCGMMVAPNSHPTDYQGQPFAFCSAQCHERFVANPHLYIGRPGQPAPKQQGLKVLKRRKFVLDLPLDTAQAAALSTQIGAMMGIEALDVEAADIAVTYDLLQATAEQIEAALAAAGAQLGSGWAERLRRGFVHYTEECEIGQLQVGPPSGCH
ncbi:MAG: YHS domain-containing protein [Rhodocyclaceae bacterium]|nr:MAG: YHS domain-containing protein [Pseudomonadota bacterium]